MLNKSSWDEAVMRRCRINLLTRVSAIHYSSNRSHVLVPAPAHWNFIDLHPAVCQKNFTGRIDQVTNKVPNSPSQTLTRHQVSTPYPFTALAFPSFPSYPGTSIFMDGLSEGSLMVDNYACFRTRKDIRSRSRRMSLLNIPQLLN